MAAQARAASTAAALLLTMVVAGCGTRPAGAASTWPAAASSGPAPAGSTPAPVGVRSAGAEPSAATRAVPVPAGALPARADDPADGARIDFPRQGGGAWRTSDAQAAPADRPGRLLRYRVRVERDIEGVDVDDVADTVTRALDDPRGWTAGGTLNLRRVAPGEPVDFTVYLATPGTRDRLCGQATTGYTSCRNGDNVVLNVARWARSVPDYGAGLAAYRAYMVNHEVGHRLGHGHELCPGPGQPAPVMQQQTLGLHGCTANSWPYRDGSRYTGPSGAYDDEPPAESD